MRDFGLAALTILPLVLLCPARATDLVWANSAGNADWLSGASWSGGNVPGANDVAVFPTSTSVPLAQPSLNGSASIDGLRFDLMSSQANSWQIEGSGTLTIRGNPGASGYGIYVANGSYNTRIYPNIVLGGPQTWSVNYWSGNPILLLYGTLSGAGPLTKHGVFPVFYQNATAPSFAGGLIVSGGIASRGIGARVRFSLLDKTAVSSVGFGTGTIALRDRGGFSLYPTRPVSGTIYTQTVTNDFVVEASGGFLVFEIPEAANSWLPGAFSGAINAQGPLLVTCNANAGPTDLQLSGPLTLDRSVPATKGLYHAFDAVGAADNSWRVGVDVNGAITDSAGGPFPAQPLVLRTRTQAALELLSTGNTYAGGTVVEFCGDTARNSNPGSQIRVDAASSLGSGDLLVAPGGRLRLLSAAALDEGAAIRVQSTDSEAGVLVVNAAAANRLTALTDDSEGVIAIADGARLATALDMATLGGGRMFLGGQGDSSYYDATTLTPGIDKVYRLGGGMGNNHGRNRLDLSSTSLSLGDDGGVCSVQVGRGAFSGSSYVRLFGNNPFSGDLRVVGQTAFHDIDGSAELIGRARTGAGQGPFGGPTGDVILQHGRLTLEGVSGGQPVVKRNLVVDGVDIVALDATTAGYATSLQFDSIIRTNKGVVIVDAVRGSFQANEKLLVTNGIPATLNGILPPWILARVNGGSHRFATYDAVNGLGKYDPYDSMPSPGTGTEVVSADSITIGDARSVWAMSARNVAGSGSVAVNGGGLVLWGTFAPALNFGTAEGVVYSLYANPATCAVSGKVSGSGGLTVAGGAVRLSNTGNDFTGPITVSQSTRTGYPGVLLQAEFDSAPSTARSLGNADNDILLNGGAIAPNSWNMSGLLASRTVTLGSLGGYLLGNGSWPYTIYGPIVGDGFLVLSSHGDGAYGPPNVTLDSAGNTYGGGTRVCGTLTVNSGSSVGTGPVMLHYGTATFKGDENLSTGARLHACLDTIANFQSASPAIGSLVGAGRVVLGATSVDTTLTVGQDDTDCAFYGEINQLVGRTCCVTKAGSGTWTLHGRNLFTGATTVSAGSLKLAGSLAGGLVVGSGGGLTVDVGPDGATYGEVAGTVALDGTLTVNLADGYTPPVGSSWTILGGASSYSGNFASVSEPGLKAMAVGGDLVLTRVATGTAIFIR